jgi:threonine dehydrogenase-like Zn-dependent dehydrogenase
MTKPTVVDVRLREDDRYFEADLPRGTVAIVDGDAAPDDYQGPVAAVVLPADGIRVTASRMLAAAAAPILSALDGIAGPVEVHGSGALAALLGSQLVPGTASEARRPAAVVDLTGEPSVLQDALRRLDDLGTLVLVAGGPTRAVDVDLYPDVHRRGLILRGSPGLTANEPTWSIPQELESAAAILVNELVEVEVGVAPARSAQWYRLAGSRGGDEDT